jgi:GxxExxY protein
MPQSFTEANQLTGIVLKQAFDVHSALGPGLLESAYKECLQYRLNKAGLFVEREKAMPIVFEEIKLEHGYRIDLLVENQLVVELKSIEVLTDLHTAQVLTYMKFGGYKLGLLLNFNVTSLRDGIKRLIR